MAEAVVDGAPISRFFCHKCSVEIEHLLPDYTCPNCSCGFIEELEHGDDNDGSGMDVSSEDLSETDANVSRYFPQTFAEELSEFVLEMSGAGDTISGSLSGGTATGSGDRNNTPGGERRVLRLRDQIDPRRPGSGRDRQAMPMMIENLIQHFIFNLSGAGWDVPGNVLQPPVLFLGNPGDYVWGRDGLDAIVTQLLNQMDGTGPPPLPREQIDQIPSTTVSQEQVDGKLQCSVCWEDFNLAEPVRQLPCQHCYHAPCIVPWLELHGTCPICRQSLGDQNSAEANQDRVAPSLAALFRAANESVSSRTSSTTSTSAGSSSSSDSTNEI